MLVPLSITIIFTIRLDESGINNITNNNDENNNQVVTIIVAVFIAIIIVTKTKEQ